MKRHIGLTIDSSLLKEIDRGWSGVYIMERNVTCLNNYGIILRDGPEDNPYPKSRFLFNIVDYATSYP